MQLCWTHVKPDTKDLNHTQKENFQQHFFFIYLLSYCTAYDDLFSFSYMNSLTDYRDKVTLKLIKGLIVSEHLSEMSDTMCNGLCTSSINGTPVCCFLFNVQYVPPKNTQHKYRKAGRIHQDSPSVYQKKKKNPMKVFLFHNHLAKSN